MRSRDYVVAICFVHWVDDVLDKIMSGPDCWCLLLGDDTSTSLVNRDW